MIFLYKEILILARDFVKDSKPIQTFIDKEKNTHAILSLGHTDDGHSTSQYIQGTASS